jgi:SAM-dependent methyltransferase
MSGLVPPRLRLFADEPAADGHLPAEATDRLFHREAFRKPPRGINLEPFSRDWFARIEADRYRHQGYWLPRSLEFSKHAGETVLGLGEGLGTDWIQFARNGAEVVTVSPSMEQLDLIRTHFEMSALPGRFLHGSTDALPLPADSIDVACVHGLLHEVDDSPRVVAEVYRVLRPGGKVIVVAPAKYSAGYWSEAVFPWRRWLCARKADPIPHALTGRRLKGLFSAFSEHRLSKRHLRRGELPPVWRWLPLPAMERLMGNSLVLKAFKPLSAAVGRRAA